MKKDLTASAYIFHNDRVLLVFHKKLQIWLPPGGHVEQNEAPDETARREIREETNLEVELLNCSNIPKKGNVLRTPPLPFYINEHSVGDHIHCNFYYAGRALNAERMRAEDEGVEEARWFRMKELPVTEEFQDQISAAYKIIQHASRPAE